MIFRSSDQVTRREQLALTARLDEIRDRFDVVKVTVPYEPRQAILPTEQVPIIVGRRRERQLIDSRWGLFPFWAKDSVHADWSGVLHKPVFDRLLKKQRCIVPGTALKAVVEDGGKTSRTVSMTVKDSGLFAMAGLYEERVDPRGAVHRSCTIVTTGSYQAADGLTMPLLLNAEEQEAWLDPDTRDKSVWQSRLRPSEEDRWVVRIEQQLPIPLFHD